MHKYSWATCSSLPPGNQLCLVKSSLISVSAFRFHPACQSGTVVKEKKQPFGALKSQLTRKSPIAASETTSMWCWCQLAQLRWLVEIRLNTSNSLCRWLHALGLLRAVGGLIVCFDFVKLVSELEIRPERLPSTLPHTRAVFLARGPRR